MKTNFSVGNNNGVTSVLFGRMSIITFELGVSGQRC